MEDEGYTSPPEELESHKQVINSSSASEKYPYFGRIIQSWEDLGIKKPDPAQQQRGFFSDNHVPCTAEFIDWIWKRSPIRDGSGSLAALKSSTKEPTYIPMSEFISHLIHLLNGRESESFTSIILGSNTFKRNPYVLVKGLSPTALDQYSVIFIETGERFKKLSKLANNVQNGNTHGSRSTLFTAFQKALGGYLKIYQTVLMLQLKSVDNFTKLLCFIEPFHAQLEVLEKITDLAIQEAPMTFLSELNRLIFSHGVPHIVDLLRSLFIIVGSTYMGYISDWVFRGELGPSREFHIRNRGGSVITRDRRFWTRQFEQSDQEFPLFIEDSTDLIFETGKSINLFNLIKTMDSPVSSSLFSYDTDQMLSPCLSFQDLPALALEWDSKLHRFLTQNVHLRVEVADSISEVIAESLKEMDIDFSSAAAVRLKFESNATFVKSEVLRKKRLRQKELRISLQMQVDESKLLKSAEAIRDQIEYENNTEYNIRKEKDYDDEKIKFHQKYFPLENTPVLASINTYRGSEVQGLPFIQSLPQAHEELEKPKESQQWDSVDDQANLRRPPYSSLPPASKAKPPPKSPRVSQLLDFTRDFDEIDHPNPKSEEAVSRKIITRKRNYNKKVEKSIHEILYYKQGNNSTGSKASNLDSDDNSEKLDPDKLILTKSDPIPRFDLQIFNEKPKGLLLTAASRERLKPKSESTRDPLSCINYVFAQSVLIPVRAQHKMVNTALLHYFVKEKQLFHHVSAVNEFLLLQNGVFGHSLSTLLIEEIRKLPLKSTADLEKRAGRLNMILSEAVSIAFINQDPNAFAANLSFTLVQEKDVLVKEFVDLDSSKINSYISSEFQILNALRLNYSVQWPLNILLTDEMINRYENLFGVFMQLLRSELLLEQVFLNLKCKCSKSSQLVRLQLYRHKLLHYVRSLRFYMNVVIVHSSWAELCGSLNDLDTLQKIYDHLVHFTREISNNCFIGKGNGILKLIVRQLAIVDSFCSQIMRVCVVEEVDWNSTKGMSDQEFKTLRHKYKMAGEYQKLFLRTLYKASGQQTYSKVDSFLEFFDFNNFYEVSVPEIPNSGKSVVPPLMKTTSVPAQSQSSLSSSSSFPQSSNTTTSFYL